MSWISKIESERGNQVYLVRGKVKNKQAWYYVFVDKLKVTIFLKMIDEGSLNLEDYGEVLYSGWGNDPPKKIVEKIKEEYP